MARDEQQWAEWMRLSLAGDKQAYQRFLSGVTPHLRALTRRRIASFAGPSSDIEDVVQEVLLAIHLKRHTWDATRPLGPWLSAIVRNKLIDAFRRRGRHVGAHPRRCPGVCGTNTGPPARRGDHECPADRDRGRRSR